MNNVRNNNNNNNNWNYPPIEAPRLDANPGNQDATGADQLIQKGLKEIGSEKSEKAVIFIGNTGSGKTTLVNIIAGRQLVFKNGIMGEVYIDVPEPLPNFSVGHSVSSGTSVTHRWTSSRVYHDYATYWDCPGFEDNRGPVQELANAVFMQAAFKQSMATKIVVVIKDEDMRNPRCSELLRIASILDKLFLHNLDNIRSAVSLIISRTPNERTTPQIKAVFDNILQSPLPLDKRCRDIFLILKKSPITLFGKPEQDQNPDSFRNEMQYQVLRNISKTNYVQNLSVNPSVTPGCQNHAVTIYNALVEEIKEGVKEFSKKFRKCINEIVASYLNEERFINKLNQANQLNKMVEEINRTLNKEKSFSVSGIKEIINTCITIASIGGKEIKPGKIIDDQQESSIKLLKPHIGLEQDMRAMSEIINPVRDLMIDAGSQIEKAVSKILSSPIRVDQENEQSRRDAAVQKAVSNDENRKENKRLQTERQDMWEKIFQMVINGIVAIVTVVAVPVIKAIADAVRKK